MPPSQDGYGAACDRTMCTFNAYAKACAAAFERSAAGSAVEGRGGLDLEAFCALVRSVEGVDDDRRAVRGGEAQHGDERLRRRFAELDTDGSGRIEAGEFLRFALLDALTRARKRVYDIFVASDADRTHAIDRDEWRTAVTSMGFGAAPDAIDALFSAFDEDGFGKLTYAELTSALRPASIARNRHALRTAAGRKTALGAAARLDAAAGLSIEEQLQHILHTRRARVMDLFREWDADGDGTITPAELRAALLAMGYDVDRDTVQRFFAAADRDGSGCLQPMELYSTLRRGAPTKGEAPGEGASGGDPAATTDGGDEQRRVYGSRPVGGWDFGVLSWAQEEANRMAARAATVAMQGAARRRAISSLRANPLQWSDAGHDYSRAVAAGPRRAEPPPRRAELPGRPAELAVRQAESPMRQAESPIPGTSPAPEPSSRPTSPLGMEARRTMASALSLPAHKPPPLSGEALGEWWQDACLWSVLRKSRQQHAARAVDAGAIQMALRLKRSGSAGHTALPSRAAAATAAVRVPARAGSANRPTGLPPSPIVSAAPKYA